MIVDEATELGSLAGEVIVLRRSQQHGQSIAHRTQLVDALLARSQLASATGTGLSERLGERHVGSPVFETALMKISEWRQALDEDLGSALGGDIFSSFQDAIEKAVREIERRTTTAWQTYAAQATPETSKEILDALADDPRARVTVIKIKRLAETTRRLREKAIPSIDEIREFDDATAELREAWSTLDVASLNEEIVAFLRAANSERGADLELLTSTVLDWLDQRDAKDHYAIRPSER
jgi:hypothetical protein